MSKTHLSNGNGNGNSDEGSNGTIPRIINYGGWLMALILGVVAFMAPMQAQQVFLQEQQTELRNIFMQFVEDSTKEAMTFSYNSGKSDQKIDDLRTLSSKLEVDLNIRMNDILKYIDDRTNVVDGKLQTELKNTILLLTNLSQETRDTLEKTMENQVANRADISRLEERLGSFISMQNSQTLNKDALKLMEKQGK